MQRSRIKNRHYCLAALTLLLAAATAFGQGGNTLTLRFPGVPTGGCAPIMLGVDNATGILYSCTAAGTWQAVGVGIGFVTGAGTVNTLPKFTGATVLGDSLLSDNATTLAYVGANTTALIVNASTGFQANNLAPLGHVLRGDDTNFVSAPLNYSDLGGNPTIVPGQNGLISGGEVAWAGDLIFTVSTATYGIAGNQYTSAQTNITLDAADGTDDRIDVIAVDDTGTVVKVTGTPGAPPSPPWVDPTSQLQLTFIYVAALATVPSNVTQADLYLEGVGGPTEWNAVRSPATNPPWNLVSTNNPYAGTKDIEATSAVAGNYITLTKPAGTVNLSNYNNLVFYIRSKASWPNPKSLVITWLNGATQVGSAVTLKSGTLGFVSSITASYQQLVIPTSSFATASALVDVLKIQVNGGGAAIGFYLDNIELQGGISTITLPTNLMIFCGAWSATTSYAPNDVVTNGGISYVALLANTNVTPVAGTTWTLLGTTSTGTVTNVATSAPLAGGPITTTGTLSITGAAGQVLAGATPAFTATPTLGVDNSVAGTLTLANSAAAAHTVWSSAATTTNTIAGFATVPATGHLVSCTTAGTTCTLTDGGAVPTAGNYLTRTVVNDTFVATINNTPSVIRNNNVTGGHGSASAAQTVDTNMNGSSFAGVTLSGGGATGSSVQVVYGEVNCIFDNATVQGDYVGQSSTDAARCHDWGTPDSTNDPAPGTRRLFGFVKETHGSAGTYPVFVTPMSPSVQGFSAGMVWPYLVGNAHSPFYTSSPLVYDPAGTVAIISNTPLRWYSGTDATTRRGELSIYNITPNIMGFVQTQVHLDRALSGFTHPLGVAAGVMTLSFDAGMKFYRQLQGNITSVTGSNYVGNGEGPIFPLKICQDGTGGRKLTWGAEWFNPSAVPAIANDCTFQWFADFDNSAAHFKALAPATPIHPTAFTSKANALAATTIANPMVATLMRFNGTVTCVAESAGATVALNLIWTDTGNNVQTISVTATCTVFGAASIADMVHAIRVKPDTAVQYSTTIVNTPTYDLDVSLETIQ